MLKQKMMEGQKPFPEQEAALSYAMDWWRSPSKNLVISGEPGTGKTWLTKYLVNRLRGAVPLYTAPTNEAVRQLQLSLGSEAATKTTFSAFGLTLATWVEHPFIIQGRVPEDLNDFNLLVVDEASMVGKKEKEQQAKRLADYVLTYGIKTIWLGDDFQLPPIESEDGTSPIFKEDWPRIHLTQVVRHDGPILQFARALREEIKKPVKNLPSPPEGIDSLRMEAFLQSISESFPSEEIYSDLIEGNGRMICWTNPQVDKINRQVRNRRFGADVAGKYFVCPEDNILLTKPLVFHPYMEKLETKLSSLENLERHYSINTKGEVLKVSETEIFGVPCYKVHMEMETGNDGTAYIPTLAGEKLYKNLIKSLTDAAKAEQKGTAQARAWELKHAVDSCFAKMKHSYAITGHRSQGSTIDSVYVDVANMLQNRDRLVAFKNLYVASTRAKNKLTLVRG